MRQRLPLVSLLRSYLGRIVVADTFYTLALWCLDYTHTISSEIDVLLSGNMTGTIVLYLINRYTFFGYIIVQVLQIIPGRMTQDA